MIRDIIPYFLTSMDEAPPAPPITPRLVIKQEGSNMSAKRTLVLINNDLDIEEIEKPTVLPWTVTLKFVIWLNWEKLETHTRYVLIMDPANQWGYL